MPNSIQLSILDQTPIRKNSNAPETLRESIRMARLADNLGYTRYWLSEHHNTINLAEASPEIFIARLAAETRGIRVGSGGIMLPNYSTLKVAENFRLLEALYPGRIDLGLGRGPGGDRLTTEMLNPTNTFDPKEYIAQVHDLRDFLADQPGPGNFEGRIRAIPRIDTQPEMWMLSSSRDSALTAAQFGMAVCYAQFINPVGGAEALRAYRDHFRPSSTLGSPKAAVTIFAFCSEDPAKVAEIQALVDYRLHTFEKGRYEETPTVAAATSYPYTTEEWQKVRFNRQRTAIGSPDLVKDRLNALADEFGVDEIVLTIFTEEAEDRFCSYRLLAEIFALEPREFPTFGGSQQAEPSKSII